MLQKVTTFSKPNIEFENISLATSNATKSLNENSNDDNMSYHISSENDILDVVNEELQKK